MDILTQGLLGGVMARAVAHDKERKIAVFAGIVAGLLADADILIRSTNDPLLTIEYHRHFTHSLLFIPFGAAMACLLLWPFVRRHLELKRLYLFCLAGFSMSGILDALTSYGTMLFWPFSDQRVAWNLISIVDPIFTLILLLTLFLGLKHSGTRSINIGLALCVIYVGLGFVQQQRAMLFMDQVITGRGHEPGDHVVKPTLGNLLLWRSIYRHDNRIHVDAVRVGIFATNRLYPGEAVEGFFPEQALPQLAADQVLYRDIHRFIRFSDGYVAYYPDRNMIGDVRYSMLPNSVAPLWGIVIDADRPQQHADYRFFRDSSRAVRQTFLNMLLGRCAKPVCDA